MSRELCSNLSRLKYMIKIVFVEEGLNYQIIHREDTEERVKICYYNDLAKEKRNEWLQIFHILEDSVHRNDMYISEGMKRKYDYLLREMRDDFRIGSDNKSLFRLMTLFFLEIPDELIYNQKKEIPSIIFMLEVIFLQHFKIGEEKELKINYEELKEMFH